MKTVYLSLGTNVGDRKVNLRRALKLLHKHIAISAQSPVYDTDPMYFEDQPRFYNMVVRGKTNLSPVALLEFVKDIEREMGREGPTNNRPRIIDIDIMTLGDEVVDTHNLKIPHARMHERAYVLVPLKDIAPKFVHPTTKETVGEMLKKIPDADTVVKKTNVSV